MVRSQHKVFKGYVGALSGVWEDTVYCLCASTVWVGVWGWWFVFPVGAGCLPATVWLVWFLVVLCENWIVDASILSFL